MNGAGTVASHLAEATRALRRAEIEDPSREATQLLAHLTGQLSPTLALRRSDSIDPELSARYHSLVARRAARTPLQHLLGSLGFHDIELRVGPGALIPRPETEILVETVLDRLRSRALLAPHVLDLGTGTGAIATAIAAALPAARIVATDASRAALALAAQNVHHLGQSDRISLVAADWLEPFARTARFDAIVSNPPYLCTAEIAACEPEVRDHDPRLALDGGADGLAAYRAICAELRNLGKPPALVAFEVAAARPEPVVSLLHGSGFARVQVRADLAGLPRVVLAES